MLGTKAGIGLRRGLAAAVVALALVPAAAQAGVGAGAVPTFPTSVTVGNTGLPASIELRNSNSAPNTGDTNTVCNFGDPLSCPAGDPGITLIPACGQLGAFSTCTAAGADAGVFQLSDTAIGEPGTACAGMSFNVTQIDGAFAQVRFTPSTAPPNVTLPGAGSICRIGFTFSVLKAPAVDQSPGAGIQTIQVVDNTQRSGALETASARGTSTGTTVLKATPTIATTASGDIVVGGQLSDTAVVGGRVNPVAGATVDFRLYGPDDATCSRPPVFESLGRPVGVDGAATSLPFTPTAPGVYRWRAFYSGDANNDPVSGNCDDANENVRVGAPPPLITMRGLPQPRGECTESNFRLRVNTRVPGLKSVRVTLDGKTIARSKQARFTVRVRARAKPFGRHVIRIVARGAGGRTIRTATFKRCGRPALPRFVG